MFDTIWIAALLLPLAAAAFQSSGSVEESIIALEQAALARSDKNDVKPFLELSDENVVYIDPFIAAPIYGRDALAKYYAGFGDVEGNASSKMTDAKVQVSGDTAVLTFRYDTVGERTGRLTRWFATEVYRKTPQGWRIIHTHWSLLQKQNAD